MILFFPRGGNMQTTQFRPVRKKMGELLCLCTFFYCAYAWQCYVLYTSLVMLMCVDRKEKNLENQEKDLTTPCNLIYELLFF